SASIVLCREWSRIDKRLKWHNNGVAGVPTSVSRQMPRRVRTRRRNRGDALISRALGRINEVGSRELSGSDGYQCCAGTGVPAADGRCWRVKSPWHQRADPYFRWWYLRARRLERRPDVQLAARHRFRGVGCRSNDSKAASPEERR